MPQFTWAPLAGGAVAGTLGCRYHEPSHNGHCSSQIFRGREPHRQCPDRVRRCWEDTQRVAGRAVDQLEMDGIGPENVVAFTFNERATAELKDRVAGIYEASLGTREGLAELYAERSMATASSYCSATASILSRSMFSTMSSSVCSSREPARRWE